MVLPPGDFDRKTLLPIMHMAKKKLKERREKEKALKEQQGLFKIEITVLELKYNLAFLRDWICPIYKKREDNLSISRELLYSFLTTAVVLWQPNTIPRTLSSKPNICFLSNSVGKYIRV